MNNAYFTVVMLGVDFLFCTWIWRTYDIKISSMCGLELRKPAPALWGRMLGGFLNWLQPGHCESSITADIARCQAALIILAGTKT
jgi:hypothetical protein